jgi:uncharacterized integral membrane protein
MLRKIVSAVIVIPLLVIVVAFAVANRHAVTVSFDPFSAEQPAYAVTLPLFVIVFVLLIVGVLAGGTATWIGQRHRRRSVRRLDTEVRNLHGEMDAMRRQLAADRPSQPAAETRQPLVLPPVP